MGIRAVIFDFNGVLVDDEAVHFALFREVLSEEGVNITERDYHERYLGYDDRGCLQAALCDAGQVPECERLDALIARKAKRYIEVAEANLRFFPAAAETLESIADRWPVAICSGALRSEIEYGLRRLDRLDRIAAIVSAEDAGKCKPDPEGYCLALTALKTYHSVSRSAALSHLDAGLPSRAGEFGAADCLVIEDSLAGIISAKGAGMQAVGVAHTYSAQQLLEAGADAVIGELATLTPEWIGCRFGC
jgi:beta-phosphoglucomutase-like phosphatase (HAD superfamily)